MRETISMPIYHSAPSRAVRGRSLVLSALVPITEEGMKLPDLAVSVEGLSAPILMKEAERTVFAEGTYAYFSAEVPSDVTEDSEQLVYTLLRDGKPIVSHEIPYMSFRSNAEMPPLVFTEMGARLPLKKNDIDVGLKFVEVMNPTDHMVDLYDYKLIRVDAVELSDDEPIREVMITNEKGTMLAPGELAILRFLPVDTQNRAPELGTVEAFADGISKMYCFPYPVDPASLRVIPVVNSVYSEEEGRFIDAPGAFEPKTLHGVSPSVIGIALREAEKATEAFHTLTYGLGTVPGAFETPTRRSSVWGLDPDAPEKACLISPAELLTPGELSSTQAYPDFSDDEAPAIVPLTVLPYYLAKGDMVMKFAVLDRCVTGAELHVKDNDGTFRTFKAYNEGVEDVYEATVPYAFLSMLDRFEYYITASDSLRKASLGSESCLYSRVLYDNAGPSILSCTPSRGYAVEGNLIPEIRIAYRDRAGVNVLKSKLHVDGKDVSKQAFWYDEAVVYQPTKPLSYGDHTISILLYDLLGNKSTYRSDFSISSGEDMNCYRGEVHSHTMESDGWGTPEYAMTFARDVGKADYFAVTEHSHYLCDEAYERQKQVADHFDEPGSFAALYGWEMTWNTSNGFWGHMNVIGADDILHDTWGIGMPKLFEYLEHHPEAVAMFNHPSPTWGNFDEFGHQTPEALKSVALSEINAGSRDSEYALVLSKGWHATPVYNGDNHGGNWTNRPSSGVVLAPALTRENIMEAFRLRRTYTTSDKTMKLKFKINGQWLGSTLKDPEMLDISVDVTSENPIGLGTLQIVAEDNIVVAEEDIGARTSYQWNLTLPAFYDYYYVRILQDKHYTATAPVWVEYENPLSIRHIRVFHDFSEEKPNDVAVRLDNKGDAPVKNLQVDFYLSGENGFNEQITKPLETVYLDKIKAGDSVCVTRRFQNISRRRRVTVIARGTVNGRMVQCTSYVLLSPLDITAVAPNTAPVTLPDGTVVENPFPYIQLFNTSNTELNLSGASLRLWSHTGKSPDEDSILSLKGVKIPPRSTYVIWRRPKGSPLTVDDFNARYDTKLAEGTDILVTELHVISAGKKGAHMHRIDIVNAETTLARIEYNMGLDCGKDSMEGNVIYYRYVPNMTGTATKITNTGAPTPDLITDEQKARDFIYFEKKKEVKGEKHAAKRIAKAEKKANAPKVAKSSAIGLALASAAGAAAVTAAIVKALGRKN
ncbi:MAG: hypothetical protein IKC26_09095 [Clostridia bacterium]|nr:hypothetical protein [Clostridia bacterium]